MELVKKLKLAQNVSGEDYCWMFSLRACLSQQCHCGFVRSFKVVVTFPKNDTLKLHGENIIAIMLHTLPSLIVAMAT